LINFLSKPSNIHEMVLKRGLVIKG
jgi:hypothetical protein